MLLKRHAGCLFSETPREDKNIRGNDLQCLYIFLSLISVPFPPRFIYSDRTWRKRYKYLTAGQEEYVCGRIRNYRAYRHNGIEFIRT